VVGETVIAYHNSKSANAFKGEFVSKTEDGKFYIEFEDGDAANVPSSWVHGIK
tara:strand:+ start:376 stop:534 length:159 start_codon:yes stop_codon:yes gene_type:complete